MRIKHQRQLGFTLIELIVSIVLLGLIAAIITPRLFDSTSRRTAMTAREVTNLLSVAAHRDALSIDRLAIEYEASTLTLRMLVLRGEGGQAQWRQDPLVPEVVIAHGAVLSGYSDGRELDSRGWRIAIPPTEPRPAIELHLNVTGMRSEGWVVALLPSATSASLSAPGSGSRPALRPIDLDSEGMGDRPW